MFLVFAEVLRACTYLVNNGKIMYWGTSRWSPFELFEAYTKAKEYGVISPIVEISNAIEIKPPLPSCLHEGYKY